MGALAFAGLLFFSQTATASAPPGTEQYQNLVKAESCGIIPGDYAKYKTMIEEEFGVGHVMVDIARAESQFQPDAWNCRSSAGGLFQILDGTWSAYGCLGNKYSPQDNIECARKIFDANGTKDWNESKSNWTP